MKRFLLSLLAVLAVVPALFAQTANDVKYSIAGGLVGSSFAYNTDNLFDYDEATATWTKTIPVTKDAYFCIANSNNKTYSYSTAQLTSDTYPSQQLQGPPKWYNMYFSASYPAITFTITEVDGKPWMAINPASTSEPDPDTVWSLSGTTNAEFTKVSDTEYTLTIGSVKKTDSYTVKGTAGDEVLTFGYASPIEAGKDYTLASDVASFAFADSYDDVILKWNPKSNQLSFTGNLSQLEVNKVKYSLGGGLFGTPLVSKYDTNYLFDYNEQEGVWTKTVNVGESGNNYFSIYDVNGKRWGYSSSAVNGACDYEQLVTAYSNMEFKVNGKFTLTIKEVDGQPWMEITPGGSSVDPEPNPETVWSLSGSTTAEFTKVSDTEYTLTIGSVKPDGSYTVKGTAGDEVLTFGYASPIEADKDYTLASDVASFAFANSYDDVILKWNPKSNQLSFTGTIVQVDVNRAKYSLGGGLLVTPMVSKYDPNYLFDYNEKEGVWTKTVKVGATGNNYFSIFDSNGKKWTYSSLAVNGSRPYEELISAIGNMEFKTNGEFTLCIKETNGVPYLAIIQDEIAEGYFVKGSFTNNELASMILQGSKMTYTIASVTAGQTFNIVRSQGDNKITYGADTEIKPDLGYTLVENGAALKFDSDYSNVTISFSPETLQFSFSGTAPGAVGTLKPSATSPSNGATIYSSDAVSTISFTFNQNQNGIETINRSLTPTLNLLRNGQIYREIDTSDPKLIGLSRNNPSVLQIEVGLLDEGGEYVLSLPADFIRISNRTGGTLGDSDAEPETDPAKLQNAQYTLTFNVIAVSTYTVDPQPGEVTIEQLQTITFTYPSGAVVSANPDFNSDSNYPRITFVDHTDTSEEGQVTTKKVLSGYSMSFKDNVVTLTAMSPNAITDEANNALSKYDIITIPAEAWKVEYQGSTELSPAISLGNYTIKAKEVEIGNATIIPSTSSILSGEDLATIEVKYPSTWTFNAWSASNPMGKREGYTVGYLRNVETAADEEGTNVGNYSLSAIDQANQTLTLKLSGDASSIVEGYYTIMLVNNMFVLPDNTRNSNLYFTGYEVRAIKLKLPEGDAANAVWEQNVTYSLDGESFFPEEVASLVTLKVEPAGDFLSPDDEYLAQMKEFFEKDEANRANNPMTTDSWIYTKDQMEYLGFADAKDAEISGKFTDNNTMVLNVPCAGLYTLTLSFAGNDEYPANQISSEFEVKPSFSGLSANNRPITLTEGSNAGLPAFNLTDLKNQAGEVYSQGNPEAVNFYVNGWMSNFYYRIVESIETITPVTYARRAAAPEGFEAVTTTVNLANAKSIELGLLKNGVWNLYSGSNGSSNIQIASKYNEDISVGVDSIADEANADAVYYNLNGIRVEASDLQPGIYIVVKGGKASKIVVK